MEATCFLEEPICAHDFSSNVVESIDVELKMTDIVAYLKGCALDQKKDIPFVANAKASRFKNLFSNTEFINKEAVCVGVYDETIEEIRVSKVIDAPSIDKQLREVLGDNSFVMLT